MAFEKQNSILYLVSLDLKKKNGKNKFSDMHQQTKI